MRMSISTIQEMYLTDFDDIFRQKIQENQSNTSPIILILWRYSHLSLFSYILFIFSFTPFLRARETSGQHKRHSSTSLFFWNVSWRSPPPPTIPLALSLPQENQKSPWNGREISLTSLLSREFHLRQIFNSPSAKHVKSGSTCLCARRERSSAAAHTSVFIAPKVLFPV